jgi:DNA mismatch repair protein MutL
VDSQEIHNAVAHALRGAIAPGQSFAVPHDNAYPHGGGGFPGAVISESGQAGAYSRGAYPPGSTPAIPHLFEWNARGQDSDTLRVSPLRALCQWRNSFILCDGPEGLSVVDQHVAHERIRFEQFRKFLDRPGPRQPFLTPWTYELPKAVAHRTEELAELLTVQGFEAEPLGQDSIAVRSAPAFLTPGESGRLLSEFVGSLAEVLRTPRDRWKEVLVMRSCRGSVMLNDSMSLEKMQYLLDTLHSLGAPLTCPHGRPIVYTLKEADLLAKFDRK